MAGYSLTPLARKLGLKPEASVLLLEMPASVKKELKQDLAGVKLVKDGKNLDFIHAFVANTAELEKGISSWKKSLAKTGMLWISWPKRTSKLASDITDEIVRETGLASGLVDIKVCAIDADWSGLKFVYRKTDR